MLLKKPLLDRLGPQARAVAESLELHYRAEIAEALISGKAPSPVPRSKEAKGAAKSLAATALEQFSETGDRQRMKIAKRLMNEGLSARDRARLKKWVQPGSKIPMAMRSGVGQDIQSVLELPEDLMRADPETVERLRQIVIQFGQPYASLVHQSSDNDENGRPDDQAPPDQPSPDPDEGDGGDDGENAGGGQGPLTVPYNTLRLNLERMRCLDSTNGEWRDDEMRVGGVSTHGPLALGADPSQAEGRIFGSYNLGDFNDGRVRTYSPPRELEEWDISGITLPHLFLALTVLAESDPGGGFSGYLSDMLTNLEAELPALFTNIEPWAAIYFFGNAGLYVPFIIGFATSTGPIGIIIAAIALVVVAIIFAIALGIFALVHANRDDIFEIRECLLLLDQTALQYDPFYGNARSQTKSFVAEGDGGRYEVFYHWLLADPDLTFQPSDQDPPIWSN